MRKSVICGLSISLLTVIFTTVLMVGATGDTRVVDAVMKGDKEGVRALLKQAADVNAAQGDGMTALHYAALKGDAELAQMLLYAGANVKATTRLGGYTPLYFAAKAGNAAVVDVLLKAGADAKASVGLGITPLMMAASSGNPEAVTLLLDKGADPNVIETEHGQTALGFAAAFDRADAIKALVQHGAKIDLASKVIAPPAPQQRGGNFAQVAQGQGQGQAPAQAQAGAPARGQAAAGTAGAAGAQAAQAGRGGRGGRGGQGAPAQAAGNGAQPPDPAQAAQQQQQMNGADAGSRGGGNPKGGLTPLMYAARQGNLEAAKMLLDLGAKIDGLSADKTTALVFAIINAHFDLAKLFIERGANVNLASVDGAVPLYVVANTQWARHSFYPQPTPKYEKTSYLDLMKMLLDRGADPNARLTKDLWFSEYNFSLESATAAGTTAFWKCAEVGDIDGMKLLLSRGADPNISSTGGVTALLMASGAGVHGNDDVIAPPGRMAAVKYLVEELHADVNAADGAPTAAGAAPAAQQFGRGRAGGFTALHNAAARGDNEMILYLVSKGARVDAVANSGATVVDQANGPRQRIQPYPETVALLEMLGSKNNHKCVSC